MTMTDGYDDQDDFDFEYDRAHDRADEFVSSMELLDRVIWLQRQRIPDARILDALLEDPELDELTRDLAHEIAASFVNGGLAPQVPSWLA